MAELIFPTELHQQTTKVVTDFFLQQPNIDTILLVNSLSRGEGTPDSDIDIAVLVTEKTKNPEITKLENLWKDFLNSAPTLTRYKNSGRFAQIHLDIIDGVFEPATWEEGGVIDSFEIEIGNRLLYAAPLADEGEYFKKLKSDWLPYYGTALQTHRLKLAKDACLYELDHVPLLVRRKLYFHAFDRLYLAFQRFLQALFIKRKTYPIAYNKWIKKQVVEILKIPGLYKELGNIISVNQIESTELNEKAKTLNNLLKEYC